MAMQHGELVKLFPNLESLDLRQPTKAAFEDYQSRCQQLRSLTQLNSLKLYWEWTWGKTALSQVHWHRWERGIARRIIGTSCIPFL